MNLNQPTGAIVTRSKTNLTSCILILGSVLSARGQETREQAVAAMPPPDPKTMDSTYATPAPFAQKLVDDALAKHPEVILIAIHAQPPGHNNVIIASNFGRIGKLGDEDDMRCIRTGKSNLEVNSTGKHFEDELALKDKNGHIIGAVGIVFPYRKNDIKASRIAIADQIGAEMSAKLPSLQALFINP